MPEVKIDFNGRKLECSSNFNSCERNSVSGIGMGSWSDLSSSNAAKTDEEPMGTNVSNRIAEIAKSNSTSNAVKADLDKDSEIFENPQDGKDQGDFVDYSWANIGSFDDLDQIFSNDDPIFGNVSLGTAELWSSSNDVTNSPIKSFPLSEDHPNLELGALNNTSEHVVVKSEFEQQGNKSLTLSNGKLNDPAHDLQSTHSTLDHVEYAGVKSMSFEKDQTDLCTRRNTTASNCGPVAEHVVTSEKFPNKGYKQKNPLRGQRKLEENSEGKLLQDLYGTWPLTRSPSVKFENQLAHPVVQSSPSSVHSQQRQLPKSETLQYQQISNSFVTPSAYGNLTNPYPAMPVLSHMQSGEFKHQSLSSCYNVSPGKAKHVNKSAAAPAKSLTMTPQEKIEKLRRRQQMQAMLAIQKQQQQFSHQVSKDHSNPQNFQENKIQLVDGADLEVGDLSALPSFDPNSPVEQDDSNTSCLAVDNNPVADTILYRLQVVIAQLDLRIRLCIRDSLFRLAQSTMQRHYASDTGSTNKCSRDEPEVVTEADSKPSSRYLRMPDAETETNPIDRAVAHLLFHRPLDLPGKYLETPESPVSAKFSCEHATMSLVSLPNSCMPKSSKITQNISQLGPNDPCSVPEPQLLDQFKTSPCMDTSENASYYGPTDSGAAEVEASQ
ncbi:protein LNK2 [Citrus sinensis]|nr:protein LNK2 [Citrus sinensis]